MKDELGQTATANEALQFLGNLREDRSAHSSYREEPIPSPTDMAIEQACRWYRETTDEERRTFSMGLTSTLGDFLLVFSERMATGGVRSSNVDPIRSGLLAIAMLDIETLDFRECLPIMSLHHDAATRINADIDRVFSESATYASAPVREQLTQFPSRGELSIRAMGYVDEMSPEGFTYRRTW